MAWRTSDCTEVVIVAPDVKTLKHVHRKLATKRTGPFRPELCRSVQLEAYET